MAGVIFDSAKQNEKSSTLDEQHALLRGVRTKRGHSRRAQRQVDGVVTSDDTGTATMHSHTHHHRSVDEYSEVMRQENATTNAFASYLPKPKNLHFDTQNADEHVILVLRKHPLTQLRWILSAILFAFIPVLFNGIGLIDFLPTAYQTAALIIWYFLLTGFIIESFLTWFFNVNIITDERIIDVDFLSLIYRNISSAKIDNIEDVTAVTGGAIRSLFDFGTVTVQTAAQQREFEFIDVPHPARVTKLLNELLLEEEREKMEGRVS